jgi:hypothetical protein
LDVKDGGLWEIRSMGIGGWDTTLLRLKGFSPNACRFDIHFYRDGGAGGPNRLTLVEYTGKGESWMDYDVRISGSIAQERDASQMRELFRLNGISPKNIWVDITNLEHIPGVKWETAGPWRRLRE